MNHRNTTAQPSRSRDESADRSAVSTSVIMALSSGATRSFTDLVHETNVGQARSPRR
jgi:hypothetical protein